MERFTCRLADGTALLSVFYEEKFTCGELIDALLARLAAYEDTGLEPEEIEEIAARREITPKVEYTIDKHLQELLSAGAEGRLLVLPCKVGDTVYKLWYAPCHNGESFPDSSGCDGCHDACDIRKEITEHVVPDVRFILTHFVMNNTRMYFLTREEAEEKLHEEAIAD